jgi:hypothetical protein
MVFSRTDLPCRSRGRTIAFWAWWLSLTVLLGTSGYAAGQPDTPEQLLRGQASATHPACAAAVIALENASEIPTGHMLLSGRPSVALRRFHALRVSRPELFPFQRFESGAMRGTLSNGCPFQIWWSGNPTALGVGEIRFLSTVPPLDPQYAYLQTTPDQPPSWTPFFDGYRHVMSSVIAPGSSYVGLWNRTDGTPGSLVATYDVTGSRVSTVGTANWTYDGIYYGLAIHQFHFTLIDIPEGSKPLYIAVFEQVQAPGNCCRRSRRR